MVALQTNSLPAVPVSHMGTTSSPGRSTSDPTPCLQTRNKLEDGSGPWDSAPVWDTLRKLMAPDFR